jgi:hypothetical protein
MGLSLTECLSVADSAREGVILHVSASNEGQEWGDETGQMKKGTKRQILQTIMPMIYFL